MQPELSLVDLDLVWNAACAQWEHQPDSSLLRLVELALEARIRLRRLEIESGLVLRNGSSSE